MSIDVDWIDDLMDDPLQHTYTTQWGAPWIAGSATYPAHFLPDLARKANLRSELINLQQKKKTENEEEQAVINRIQIKTPNQVKFEKWK